MRQPPFPVAEADGPTNPPCDATADDRSQAPTMDDDAGVGLHFEVARNLDQVLDAWGLVYHAYRRGDLIDPNDFMLHTVPQAVGPHAAVMYGLLGPQIVTTLTGMLDNPAGLPLERLYHPQIQALRDEGRRLCEVGIFADRRAHLARSLASLLELMRHAFYYAVVHGATDILIGVHPHHAPFYRRAFAFTPFGPTQDYPTVNNNPVVPLRLDVPAKMKLAPLPRGLAYFADKPLSVEVFASRFDFDPAVLRGTLLDQFLHRDGAAAACSRDQANQL